MDVSAALCTWVSIYTDVRINGGDISLLSKLLLVPRLREPVCTKILFNITPERIFLTLKICEEFCEKFIYALYWNILG